MPSVTIDVPYATAKKLRKVHGEVASRTRKGPQTTVITDVIGLVLDELPHFYERGDEVSVADSELEWTVEEIVDNGKRALCVTFDRAEWEVFNIDDLAPVDDDDGQAVLSEATANAGALGS